MDGVTLRTFPESDRGKILYREYILREVNKGIWDRLKYFLPESYHNQTNICVIDSNKKIIAATGMQQSPHDPKIIWTTFISTDPAYRGRGLARMLVRARFDYMRKFHPGKTLQISSYTNLGFLLIKPIIDELSKEYPDVPVIENGFKGIERTLNSLREELVKNGRLETVGVPAW